MDTIKAYFAGLFDGEGCILLNKREKPAGTYYYLQAHLCMAHKPTIEFLHFCYGGAIYMRDRKPGLWKPQYDWCGNSTDAYTFIRDIAPYCITKADEIAVAIDFYDFSLPAYSNAKGRDRTIIEAYGEHTKQLLSSLKRREYL